MADVTDWRPRALEALDRTEIMVLATVDADSGTWTSPVQFQVREDFELSFLSKPGTRHALNIERDPRVAVSIYGWPGPEGGNLGLQITGRASADGTPSGGWQRYKIRPTGVWCFDSRVDHERHRVGQDEDRSRTTN
jgi:pyridoxamine 5'-phosphate oxidase-like protein